MFASWSCRATVESDNFELVCRKMKSMVTALCIIAFWKHLNEYPQVMFLFWEKANIQETIRAKIRAMFH